MKKLLPVLLLVFVISCKKADDTASILNPDFTVGLTGIYPVTYYREGAQMINLPSGTTSGQFDITKIDLTHVSAKLTMAQAGKSVVYSTNNFELQRDSGNPNLYNAIVSGQRVGTISASEIDVSASSLDGTVTQIKAKR